MIDITGYEGLYKITNSGEVYSFHKRKQGKLKPLPDKYGYSYVILYNKGKVKRMLVHRLVCMAFLPNPENKPFVNHKNFNRSDNNTSNLEWVTPKENAVHSSLAGRMIGKPPIRTGADNVRSRKVAQLSKDNILIRTWDSINQARAHVGADSCSNIILAARNSNRTAYGFKWRYL